jgi:peroxiredoxin Q/BCP
MKSFLILSIFVSTVQSLRALALTPGQPAPAFTGKTQTGKTVKLADFAGHFLLVYFYPKDDTPGCTKEACAFRDRYAEFKKEKIEILGVSRQDAASHIKFKEKYHLPFDLLTDENGDLTEMFGIGTMPGFGFSKRKSVLIGPDGSVVKFFEDVDPGKHTEEVLAAVRSVRKG